MWVVTLVTAITSQYPGNGRPSLMENTLTKIFKWHTWSQTICQAVFVIQSRGPAAAPRAGEAPCVTTPAPQVSRAQPSVQWPHDVSRNPRGKLHQLVSVSEPGKLPPSDGDLPLPHGLDGELCLVPLVTWLTWEHLVWPGRGLRQPLPHRHLPRGLQAPVRLLQRRGVWPRDGEVPLSPGLQGGQGRVSVWPLHRVLCDPLSVKSDDVLCPVPGAVSIREIRPGLSAALPLWERGELWPRGWQVSSLVTTWCWSGDQVLLSSGLARSPVWPTRLLQARALRPGLRPHLPVSPQQHGDVSTV